MSYNNLVDTVTNQDLVPNVVDTVLRDNMFFGEVLARTEKFRAPTMLFPIKYQTGVAGVAFSGFDVLPITAQNTRVNMTYNPKFYAVNIALSGTDLSVNDTPMKVLDLAEIEMKSRAQDMADQIGNLFYLDGTSFGSKAFLGLAAIVDDGSSVATIGGLSRSTYPTLQSTVTASSGTLSLLKMRQLSNNISDGIVQPDMILTDYGTYALYEQLLMPFQRNIMEVRGVREQMYSSTAYRALGWDGIQVMRDRKCTSGTLFMLNMDFLKFYGLKYWKGTSVSLKSRYISGNIYEEGRDAGNAFTWTGWINGFNMAAVNSFMIMGGELITDNPRRQGKLTGISGI